MTYTQISSLHDYQVDQLVSLYQNEFWCATRTRPDVEKMLQHTSVIISFEDDSKNLIAFCRLLTDFVYKATLYDVIVHPDYRNQQLGKLLMDAVFQHPQLKDVEHFDLNCLPQMFGFYQRWGFTNELGELSHMRRYNIK